jgi:hypothetical protein
MHPLSTALADNASLQLDFLDSGDWLDNRDDGLQSADRYLFNLDLYTRIALDDEAADHWMLTSGLWHYTSDSQRIGGAEQDEFSNGWYASAAAHLRPGSPSGRVRFGGAIGNVQYIFNPGLERDLDDAIVVGLRRDISGGIPR